MPTREIRLDLTKPLSAQPDRGHNRWHPDISPVLHVQPGDEVVFDTLDAVDAQLDLERGAEQLAGVSLNRVHPLTGPIAVEGAEPGDVLAVEVLECSPAPWGYTAQIPGFGFLRESFPEPFLVRWQLADGHAVSVDLPRVRIPRDALPRDVRCRTLGGPACRDRPPRAGAPAAGRNGPATRSGRGGARRSRDRPHQPAHDPRAGERRQRRHPTDRRRHPAATAGVDARRALLRG
jgi:hypothetical protein